MSNIFEGTGVKRYALRYRESYVSPWEYPSSLEYDTVEEAMTALNGLEDPGKYQLVEKYPFLRYAPGTVTDSPFLTNLLDAAGMGPYILQRGRGPGEWDNCLDHHFSTLEEAQKAAGSTDRVAAASVDFQYEPVEVSG